MLVKFMLLMSCYALAYILGYVIVEKMELSRFDIFNFKPFRCTSCMRGHLSWILGTALGCYYESWVMIVIAIFMSANFTLLLVKSDSELMTDDDK